MTTTNFASTIKATVCSVLLAGSITLNATPSYADFAQDFAHQQAQETIRNCEQSGGTWRGDTTSGSCNRGAQSAGGNAVVSGLIETAFWTTIIWGLSEVLRD